jgi:hypothetical protein
MKIFGIEIAGKTSNAFFLISQVSVCISKNSKISKCQMSIVTEIAPALEPS